MSLFNSTLLNEREQQLLSDAIHNIESQTDAELVTVLAKQADDYHYIPLLWASLLALLLPGAINYYPEWLNPHQLILSQWALFISLAMLFQIPALQYRLVPRRVRHWRASNLARRQFLEQNLHHTSGETGMLIFVSQAERYVEILVDRGISSKIPDAYWQAIVKQFTEQVRAGNVGKGFVECVEACGVELQRQLPATSEKNELPNHLVIL
ncbi:MAG: TPM domain-containing protein [Zhongshania sp.]|uniref:TPM domain-containing protein n=1 Tax=Zhongshania sp. TaxID=1971902 RepID=UPI0026038182|nr:TPM domain-containing protein [Zhongshania sp.]MDF1693542.1 TPM domain-containing protein [Zhongshania sp.]